MASEDSPHPSISDATLASDVPGSLGLAEVRRLYQLHSALASETDLIVALEKILRAAVEFVGTTRGRIQLLPPEDESRLEMVADVGYTPDNTFTKHFQHQGAKAVCDAVRASGHHLIIEDVENFPPLAGTVDLEVARANGIRATLNVPIWTKRSKMVGVLNAQFSEPHRPTEDQIRLLDLLAWTAADFVDRHRAATALHISEERYRTLFDSMDEGYCLVEVILNEEGRAVDLLPLETNTAYWRLTGLPNIVGQRLLAFLPPVEQE